MTTTPAPRHRHFAALFSCLLLLLPGLAQALTRPPLPELERARALVIDGRYQLAEQYLDALVINPGLSARQRANAYYYRGYSFGVRGHYRSAAVDYQRALQYDPAHQGSLLALAQAHARGLGLQQDEAQALDLALRAARSGHAPAKLFAGAALLRQTTPDQPANLNRARYWLAQAGKAGQNTAWALLATSYRARHTADPDPQQARQLYERAINLGDRIPALSGLAHMHLNGELPDADATQAIALFEEAATRGDPQAQTTLAAIHLAVAGVPDMMDEAQTDKVTPLLHDAPETLFRRAAELCTEAANAGHVPAKVQCAFVYSEGPDDLADPDLSHAFLERAARAGHLGSQLRLADLALGRAPNGEPDAIREAVNWYRAAARQGDLRAQNNLAWVLATTTDASLRNPEEALAAALAAVQANPSPGYLDTLAAAYAAAGDFEQAQQVQRRALGKLSEDDELREEFQMRLSQYEQGRPWRE